MQTVAEYGPVIDGDGRTEIHHFCTGPWRKHNKVSIRDWALLPLPWQFHDPHSNDLRNVTRFKHAFTKAFGLQTELFAEMVQNIDNRGLDIPDRHIINAIMDTRL
jgi:hypothetical protein